MSAPTTRKIYICLILDINRSFGEQNWLHMNLLIDSYVMDKFFVVIALKIINLKNGLIPKKLYKTKVAFSHVQVETRN